MKNIPKSVTAAAIVLVVAVIAVSVFTHKKEQYREISEKTSHEPQSFNKAKPGEKIRERRPDVPNPVREPELERPRTEVLPDRPIPPDARSKPRPFDRYNPSEQFPGRENWTENQELLRRSIMDASEPLDREAIRESLQSLDWEQSIALRESLRSIDREQISAWAEEVFRPDFEKLRDTAQFLQSMSTNEQRALEEVLRPTVETLGDNLQSMSMEDQIKTAREAARVIEEQIKAMREARAAMENGDMPDSIMNNAQNIQELLRNRNMNRKPQRRAE